MEYFYVLTVRFFFGVYSMIRKLKKAVVRSKPNVVVDTSCVKKGIAEVILFSG